MSYLQFRDVSEYYEIKTKRIEIESLSGPQLGVIKWYSPWRKYCFFPFDSTIFDISCMDEIQDKIKELTHEKKSK